MEHKIHRPTIKQIAKDASYMSINPNTSVITPDGNGLHAPIKRLRQTSDNRKEQTNIRTRTTLTGVAPWVWQHHWFDSRSGHMAGLPASSLVAGLQKATG